jgi:predicted HicB family RNase H-like nuclease
MTGRPRQYQPRTVSSIRLTPELHERLAAEAAARDVSANSIATKAITHYLDRLIPVDDLPWTREP